MRMLLVSEGPSDIGDPAGDRVGAVRQLVRRTLGRRWSREVDTGEIHTERLVRLHRRDEEVEAAGYAAKVRQMIRIAESETCTCVAIVVDRDGPRNQHRLGQLREGRDRAERDGLALALRTTIGVAIETMEAWLLADEKAINDVLCPEPPAGACDPEELWGPKNSVQHPKARINLHVRNATKESHDPVSEVAALVRLDLLERRCARGFQPFAEELRARAQ